MKAKDFLTENSDWFDKSPGGENLYFESEVIRMMNEYANEALRKHDVVGRSEQFYCDCGKHYNERDLEHGMCHQCWDPTKEAN